MKYFILLAIACLAFTCQKPAPIKPHTPATVIIDQPDSTMDALAFPWQGKQDTAISPMILSNACGAEYVMRGDRWAFKNNPGINFSPYWRPLGASPTGYPVDTFWVNPNFQNQFRMGDTIIWDTTYHAPGQSVPANPYAGGCTEQLVFGDSVISMQFWTIDATRPAHHVRFLRPRIHVDQYVWRPGRDIGLGGYAWRNDAISDSLVIVLFRDQMTIDTFKFVHP